MPFFIIFIIIPFAEILVFMLVGERIGFFTTLFLAFMTAIVGGIIVKHQGLQTILSIRESLNQGKLPAGTFFDGLCLVAAGALLITPGFITDTAGFLLLMPPFRAYLRKIIKARTNWFVVSTEEGGEHILEGDYETIDRDDKRL